MYSSDEPLFSIRMVDTQLTLFRIHRTHIYTCIYIQSINKKYSLWYKKHILCAHLEHIGKALHFYSCNFD